MNEHLTEQQLIDYQFKLADEAGLNTARTHLEECEECRQRLQKLVRKFASLDLLRDEMKVADDLLSRTVANVAQIRRGKVIWPYRVPALGAVAAAVMAGVALLVVTNSRQDSQMMPTAMPEAPAQKVAPASPAGQDYALQKDEAMSLVAKGVGKAEPAAPSKPSSLTTSLVEAQPGVAGRVGVAPPEPSSAPGGSVQALGPVPSVPVSASGERVEGVPPSNRGQDARDTTPYGVTTNAPDAATRMAQAPEVAEPPPFAPASAIELVVLPRRENVQLTIYNGADLTLVRERRNLTLKQGWNWLQFMWANTLIDPTSLALEPLEHKDTVQVQQLVFPPRLRGLGRWLTHSNMSGPVPFELTYFTSGLAWRAFYIGTLSPDEKTMRLESYVRIGNNSGEDYENAQTRLVVGKAHLLDEIAALAQRSHPYGSPEIIRRSGGMGGMGNAHADVDASSVRRSLGMMGGMGGMGVKKIIKEGLSEYFLYTIEGTETIPNQWGKRLLSFTADDIPVTNLYRYEEERQGTEPVRYLSFANKPEHKLGTTPLPNGTVRVYGHADGEGHLSYVGAMNVKYIPVGEKIELNLGPARLVKVEPVLMDPRTANHVFDGKGNVAGWDEIETWQFKLTNTRDIPVALEITRRFDTPSWDLTMAGPATGDGVEFKKHDVIRARFTATLPPKSQRTLEYTVTKYRGTRSESYSEREKEAKP